MTLEELCLSLHQDLILLQVNSENHQSEVESEVEVEGSVEVEV